MGRSIDGVVYNVVHYKGHVTELRQARQTTSHYNTLPLESIL